ncbi:hypothetical protein HDU76_006709 [Blyttiomyces sp. JEL0837]|nr:hypothetical protein HDU76_006709 [Blyttiomyces sp. JEL0837]
MTSLTSLFPHYLLPNILQLLKNNNETLKCMRSVSKTWRDFTDRVYFRNAILTYNNLDSFIEWISTTPTSPIPKCRDILFFIKYIELREFYSSEDDSEAVKIKTALMVLPNLKGVFYPDYFSRLPSGRMMVNQVLLEKSQQVTHFAFYCGESVEERQQVVDLTTRFFQSVATLSNNLKVVNLDFGTFDFIFNFGVITNLITVDTISINGPLAKTDSWHLLDVLSSLPASLNLLKLFISPKDLINSTNATLDTSQPSRLQHLAKLQIIFGIDFDIADFLDNDNIVDFSETQKLLCWLFPNMTELKLGLSNYASSNDTAVFQNNDIINKVQTAFTESVFRTLGRVAMCFYRGSDEIHANVLGHQYLTHLHLQSTSQDFAFYNEGGVRMQSLSLESSLFDSYDANHLRVRTLSQLGGEVKILHLECGFESLMLWNDMMEIAGGVFGVEQGSFCPNLECIVLLEKSVVGFASKFGRKAVDMAGIDKFVELLPQSVKRINVGDKISVSAGFMDRLVDRAGRRGIMVKCGRFENPAAMFCYPKSVRSI